MREKQLLTQKTEMDCHAMVVLERFLQPTKCTVLLKPMDMCLQTDTNMPKKQSPFGVKTSRSIWEVKKPEPKLTRQSFLHSLNLRTKSDNNVVRKQKNKVRLGAMGLTSAKSERRRKITETPTTSDKNAQSAGHVHYAGMDSMVSPIVEQQTSNNETVACQESDVALHDPINGKDDYIDQLANIEFSSPLGQKLIPILSKQHIESAATAKNFVYCNHTEIAESDNRCLRSQRVYCDDRWNLHNIHYVRLAGHDHVERTYEFGRRARLRRYKTLKCGLNRRSRKLLCLLQPCSIILGRGTIINDESTSENESASQSNLSKTPSISLLTDTSIYQALAPDLDSDRNNPSETHNAIRKALAPIMGDNLYTYRYESPVEIDYTRQLAMQDDGYNRPISWKELVCDEPTIVREIVDLTIESDDDDTVLVPLNSPTRMLLTPPTSPPCPSPTDEPLDTVVQLTGNWYKSPGNSISSGSQKTKGRKTRRRISNRIQKRTKRCNLHMLNLRSPSR